LTSFKAINMDCVRIKDVHWLKFYLLQYAAVRVRELESLNPHGGLAGVYPRNQTTYVSVADADSTTQSLASQMLFVSESLLPIQENVCNQLDPQLTVALTTDQTKRKRRKITGNPSKKADVCPECKCGMGQGRSAHGFHCLFKQHWPNGVRNVGEIALKKGGSRTRSAIEQYEKHRVEVQSGREKCNVCSGVGASVYAGPLDASLFASAGAGLNEDGLVQVQELTPVEIKQRDLIASLRTMSNTARFRGTLCGKSDLRILLKFDGWLNDEVSSILFDLCIN
jgi:hypothetical protein